ncbi:MAG: hypothetical protein EOP46_02720 [Sphingobacteriaceae bacterium]|nr:MAG: hypothetical protein EOP46_02720 [Sphingobacteriaceae bacterium]
MKRKGNKIANKLSAVMALAMAFVFIFITTVQALHSHNQPVIKISADDQEYVVSSEKCNVCDYVTHKQADHAHLAYQPLISAPVTKPVTLLSRSYAGIYKFTLQGFTNKGPPAFSC